MAPPRNPAVDLKQVGQLFKDTLVAVRDQAPDNDTLEPAAIEWLKAARCAIMRQIEQAYYSLDRTRDTPFSQPVWVNPTHELFACASGIPVVLFPYGEAFRANIATLMADCGFDKCRTSYSGDNVYVNISFPVPPRVAAGDPPAAPRALQVDDEFSRMAAGAPRGDSKSAVGGFGATNFARLLTAARVEDPAASSGTKSGTGNKRRASRVVKDEIEDEGPRLRSMTRASSAATLQSNAGSVRRSSRKRVKSEAQE
ncbi:hypothetical protein B0H17DRAFT_1076455 [Mycena rosella]|uniref:Uncharacterized protein n=1 Tax=Mycena rosella TaxID=1033263 RepID=A0AAD7G9K1_MYCRO|nr:hypothetical protein B0H17DRAFT_1076455 [Mycena rosella]